MDLCLALFDYVQYIDVDNNGAGYRSSDFEINEKGFEKPENAIGNINTTTVYVTQQGELPTTLTFVIRPEEQSHAQNTVRVGVNPLQMGQLILKKGNQERAEFIVDKTGKIVLATSYGMIEQNVSDVYNIEWTNEATNQEIKHNNESYFFSKAPIEKLDLYAVSITDKAVYESYYKASNTRNLLIGLLLLIASAALSSAIVVRTYKPIRDILHSVNQGTSMPPTANMDEVKYISERFTKLSTDNIELQDEIHDKVRLLRQQQAAALQAQICPHFIYNTLDAINWMALKKMKKTNPISATIANMAEVLQSSIDTSNLFSKLDEEIEVTKKYIEILDVRYDHQFDVVWNVDESLLDCVILKLCIQPIIENSAYHGLAGLERPGKIQIDIQKQNKDYFVKVSDNGVGIPPDILQELIESINDENLNSARHIGLRSVSLRLKLLYGENYGLDIESVQGQGTVCTFMLPQDTF